MRHVTCGSLSECGSDPPAETRHGTLLSAPQVRISKTHAALRSGLSCWPLSTGLAHGRQAYVVAHEWSPQLLPASPQRGKKATLCDKNYGELLFST